MQNILFQLYCGQKWPTQQSHSLFATANLLVQLATEIECSRSRNSEKIGLAYENMPVTRGKHQTVTPSPLIESKHSYDVCLEVRGEISRTVLCCMCTLISTLGRAVLTTLWIEFCHTGPISLCVDLFAFICVYFMCFCFILHSCCIIVSMVRWTWWDWNLILRPYLPSVLWHCWLGHLTRKNPSPIWPIMCLVGR